MKRFKLTLIFAFIAAVILTSCTKDFDTINIDPNNPTSVPAHLLLPSTVRQFQNTSYSTFVGGEFAANIGTPHSRVAIDFGISNALSPANDEATAWDGVSAAKAYAAHKRTRHATGRRCNAEGIRYLPIVYTSQGGVDPDATKRSASSATLF